MTQEATNKISKAGATKATGGASTAAVKSSSGSTPDAAPPLATGTDAFVTRPARRTSASKTGSRRGGPRGPLTIADRYLFWQLVGATLRGLVWFGGILLVVIVLTSLRKMSQQALPITTLAEFIWYQIPRIVQYALPMSLLFGTVQTFSELSGRGEITALWAGGMSFTRMLRAPLLWGLVLVGLVFVLQEFLVPGAETKMKELRTQKVAELGVQNDFRYEHPRTGPLKRVIQAAAFDPLTKTLIRPSVQLYRDRDVYLQISAERGSWDQESELWDFYNARITTFPSGKSRSAASVEMFSQHLQKTAEEVGDPKALLAQQNSRAEYLANGSFELVSLFELAAYRRELTQAQDRPDVITRKLILGATFGIHDKIATPLLCLALILVGAPLGLRPQRSSAGFAPGMSLLIIMLYYFVWMTVSYPGKHGTANPYLMAYLAPALTALIGLVLVWKKNR
jgi:lipopolysaccharide export system permease protein